MLEVGRIGIFSVTGDPDPKIEKLGQLKYGKNGAAVVTGLAVVGLIDCVVKLG